MDNKKILIVDDEKNIRTMIKDCLDSEEFEVDIAVNGEEGYVKISENDYHMVLMDIKMPGMTGLELLKKIRDEKIEIPVVMMTAYGTVERAVEAMKLGAIDFIGKPFSPSEIREIVKNVSERSELTEDKLETFADIIGYVKLCIISRDYEKASKHLEKALAERGDSPEPHNLLGVIAEMKGKTLKAQNHYRAAIALKPSYEAAEKNLARTVIDGKENEKIELGGAESVNRKEGQER